MAFSWPGDVLETIPVLLALILINGLLSVDNSLAIAAMASRLPEHQRGPALNWGMAGAYAFRCLCLFFAEVILQNDWVKLVGAAYLIYLMCKELTAEEDAVMEASMQADAGAGDVAHAHPRRSFFSVVCGILLLDASLSVDNVVAAVAMTPKLWAVYTGVGIGILALRFLAGYCVRLIERFPILECTAFVLVGFVGAILMVELEFAVEIASLAKFGAILAIVAISLIYDQVPWFNRMLRPVVRAAQPLMRLTARFVDVIFWPLRRGFELIVASIRPRTPT